MKVLFLGDLHGNFVATQAMEKMMKKLAPDRVIFLGDAVGKGPQNVETCDWVRENCDEWYRGNWDSGIGGKEFAEDGYFWAQLGEDRLNWLNTLPMEGEITLSGYRFRLFHGRPLTALLTASSDKQELADTFRNGDEVYDGVIFADSHRPFVRTLDCGYIMNTGSVGNSMGVPKAHALLAEGGESREDPLMFTVISVPYDNEAAAEFARQEEKLPHRESYIREILTGIYSR